jgi:hypothetical protein
VQAGPALFADDTPVKMQTKIKTGKAQTARLWSYVRDERPWCGQAPPCAWYQFSVDRKGKHPVSHLSGYKGVVHADGYTGFNGLFGNDKASEQACMVHVRRKFIEIFEREGSAIAEEAIKRIAALYAVEKEARYKPAEERESTQSWREVLLNLKSRGMNAPKLAIGDGAMGFWAAMDEVYSTSRQQRCWQHKTMNVLNCLPKLSQPKAKAAIHDIWQAETKDDATKAFDLFIKTYEPKYPKAALCLQKDREEVMAFFDFPAQHWQSVRTSNPIESAFATIRHRTKRSKGCLTRDGMLYMMFKLGQCAEQNWRKLRGFDYLAKVITGVKFKDGIEAKTSQIAA